MEMKENQSILDFLLCAELPNLQNDLPKERYRITRLSELAGKDICFELHALPYGQVSDLRRFENEADISVLLAGCDSPNWKDPRLLEKYQALTPSELVKKLLLPGEIADLAFAIETLTGYRRNTISAVKNA